MLSKAIQLSVLFIYITTSCLVVQVSNQDSNDNKQESRSFIENLLSSLTIPLGDDSEDSGFPLLFKDPSDDNSIVIDCSFIITIFNFKSDLFCLYFENDREVPFRDILSPPPQFIL